MLPALALGLLISVANIALHCTTLFSLRMLLAHPRLHTLSTRQLGNAGVHTGLATCLLLVAHVAEVMVWSLAFRTLCLAQNAHDAVYDAFLSYTSLGFSLPPNHPWKLMEPMAALNGILLAGLSAAILFEVLSRLITPPPASH